MFLQIFHFIYGQNSILTGGTYIKEKYLMVFSPKTLFFNSSIEI